MLKAFPTVVADHPQSRLSETMGVPAPRSFMQLGPPDSPIFNRSSARLSRYRRERRAHTIRADSTDDPHLHDIAPVLQHEGDI